MQKYINADQAIAFLRKTKDKFDEKENIFRESAIDVLEILPAADVIEVVHAKKVIGGGEHDGATCWFECGRCGTTVDIDDKYCKHCGARFDK